MNYVDFAIAVSIFLFFFTAVLMFSTNYFSNLSSLTKVSEFRSFSENLFNIFFDSGGVPENWEESSITPVKMGLRESLYRFTVLIRERAGFNRINEPVNLHIIFDENCQNKSWNNTIRVYDENNNEMVSEISNTIICQDQYLNQGDVTWLVNISANENKKFWVYYSSNDRVTAPDYTPLSYNISSWLPNDGDSWTEDDEKWSCTRMVCSVDNDYKVGSYSILADCLDSTTWYNLEYNPDNAWNLTEYEKIKFWLKSNTTNTVTLQLFENSNEKYNRTITPSTSWTLYEYDVGPGSTGWMTYGSPSWEGINGLDFHYNSGSANSLWIDGLHFEKESLEVKSFPEEYFYALSFSKFVALKKISYDELRKTIGENYNFRIDIEGDSYGGKIGESGNVGCYISPVIAEYENGTIGRTTVSICIWE
jgi:hypothetical protein